MSASKRTSKLVCEPINPITILSLLCVSSFPKAICEQQLKQQMPGLKLLLLLVTLCSETSTQPFNLTKHLQCVLAWS